ncbi:cationic peroxidase 2 [Physcomitrium patens]|uniref:Peroxidase n=1 Tax=Physcomitrium patens TaxID=3218 RepID=A9RQD6_PHYPA|nr:cationic peroxidase 2-like [Physcomitrium patens]XP_024364018.1 cationic peroxidase 2-like [Physcomitrium patens]PNR60548.1 hypothetical protein PHYPA_003341 [Physcomitrium patens]PNR60555.1 hypothetical protein PHYPA_003348 [Physcomitrium patens]|eukprot:XP_024363990.1 cationic peroxidase 2-like [Physcomitrella patens]
MSRSTKIGSDSQAPAPWLLTILIASSIAVQHVVHGAVQVGFYDATCSAAESIVKGAVQSAVALDGTIAASIIRLHFHDCFAQGCDASIMLTGTGSERDAPPNLSVRGYGVINDAKAQLESSCPGVVSCADIIALAARDSVEILGGATYGAETGRFDGAAPAASVNIPSPNSAVAEATPFFTNLGLTQDDMVNLLGAHTVGVSQCQFFVDRLYNFQGTGLPDPSLDATYLAVLQSRCPNVAGDVTTVALDQGSESSFDTGYFTNIQASKGVLRIDQEIANDASTSGRVNTLAASPSTFGTDFATSMIAMGRIAVLTSGSVRSDCETA